MLRHVRLGTLVALFLSVWTAAAAASPFAYITNSGSGTVSVLDVATNSVVGTVLVGNLPAGVAVNASATRVYVTNQGSNSVSVIDTSSNAVIATIGVGSFPIGIAVNPAGTRVFVANFVSHTLSAIDATTNTVLATVPVGRFPIGVAVDPAGTRVFVTIQTAVAVVDAGTNTLLTTITAGSRPFGVAVNLSGTRVYVANQGSNTVSVLDPVANASIAEVAVGARPQGISVSPDGARVYVANESSNTVSVIETAGNTLINEVPVGGQPYGVQVSPDGARVYVANFSANTVSVLDAATGTVTASVAVGNSPIAFGEFLRSPIVATRLVLDGVSPEAVILGSSGPVNLAATLTRKDTGAGVGGATVQFLVDGATAGSATTGADGAATLHFNPSSLVPGMHTVEARFAGATLSGLVFDGSSSSSRTLQVRYNFAGFLPPINNTGWNVKTAGSTAVFKWRLTDAGGSSITAMSTVQAVQVAAIIPCEGGAPGSAVDARSMGTLRYDPAEDQFTFQWRTPKEWAGQGQCVRFILSLNDATVHSADLRFR